MDPFKSLIRYHLFWTVEYVFSEAVKPIVSNTLCLTFKNSLWIYGYVTRTKVHVSQIVNEIHLFYLKDESKITLHKLNILWSRLLLIHTYRFLKPYFSFLMNDDNNKKSNNSYVYSLCQFLSWTILSIIL
jgi:hypothetical protein